MRRERIISTLTLLNLICQTLDKKILDNSDSQIVIILFDIAEYSRVNCNDFRHRQWLLTLTRDRFQWKRVEQFAFSLIFRKSFYSRIFKSLIFNLQFGNWKFRSNDPLISFGQNSTSINSQIAIQSVHSGSHKMWNVSELSAITCWIPILLRWRY